MRVAVGRLLRVGPGDEVIVQAQLPATAQLGRLFVFSREGTSEFSPHVPMPALDTGKPSMVSPLSLRLTQDTPKREFKFVSDIHGAVRLMQEVDTLKDPRAKIKLRHTPHPGEGFVERWRRRIMGWLPC